MLILLQNYILAGHADWKGWLSTVEGRVTTLGITLGKDIVGRYVHPPHTHTPLHLTHTQPTLDGGSFSSETEGRDEAAATSLPPPSEKEQHQMALLWAMEEVNSPKGWEEEEELDYSAVSRRREERKENGKHCF